jgi:3-methyl-2-oxobutanoate hydroxymethyltransferase
MKKTVTEFRKAKNEGKKIAMLTAYDYSTAKMIDSCDVDGILVGDSLGMVCLGYKDTLSVTMEDMIHHTKAVSRGGSKRPSSCRHAVYVISLLSLRCC